jgi:hypothetical protein
VPISELTFIIKIFFADLSYPSQHWIFRLLFRGAKVGISRRIKKIFEELNLLSTVYCFLGSNHTKAEVPASAFVDFILLSPYHHPTPHNRLFVNNLKVINAFFECGNIQLEIALIAYLTQ